MSASGIGIGWRRNASSSCWRKQPDEMRGLAEGNVSLRA
jgi:hypothetical protein